MYDERGTTVYATVEYFDAPCQSFGIHYDSNNPTGALGGAYTDAGTITTMGKQRVEGAHLRACRRTLCQTPERRIGPADLHVGRGVLLQSNGISLACMSGRGGIPRDRRQH